MVMIATGQHRCSGQRSGNHWMRDGAEKYAKFVYSTRYTFQRRRPSQFLYGASTVRSPL
jgi:hypothetical protein